VEIQFHAFITLALGREERSVSYSGLFTSEDTAPLFTEWEMNVFQSGSGNSGEWTPNSTLFTNATTTTTTTTNISALLLLILLM